MANDKTEKATPKKKDDARKKGQVAKSADINGAAILLGGLIALSAAGPKAMEQMKLAMVQVIDLMAHPQVVDRQGVGTLFMMVGQHIGLAILPIVGTCFVAGLARLRRPGRPQADAGRPSSPTSRSSTRPQASRTSSTRSTSPSRRGKNIAQDRDRGRDRRRGGLPEARRDGRPGGHAAAAADPAGRRDGHDDRPARRDRLPVHRRHRLRVPEAQAQQGSEDGQGGGQAGVQAAGPSCRNQICAAQEGNGALPLANDGRSSHRRRDRHEPHPLLRRAQVRERELGTHRGRQGCRQPRVQDP